MPVDRNYNHGFFLTRRREAAKEKHFKNHIETGF